MKHMKRTLMSDEESQSSSYHSNDSTNSELHRKRVERGKVVVGVINSQAQ